MNNKVDSGISRSKNAIRNFNFSIFLYIIHIISAFFLRKVFIKFLGITYLGVSGLFSNILIILSFAELGLGHAIIYSMYKPVKENDFIKIKSLLNLYKQAYIIISIVVLVVGLLVLPFLKYIIHEEPNIKENIYIIYVLYLLNTFFSYWGVYRKALISAYQREYINTLCHEVCYFIQFFLQYVILIKTKDFILFLLIQILFVVINNFVSYQICGRIYPWIKDKKAIKVSDTEKKIIFSNVKSLVLYKLGSVILNGTDNIILSYFVNITIVGLCSNYTLLVSTATSLLSHFHNSFTAGIGNLNVSDDNNKKEYILRVLLMLATWLYGFFASGIFLFANDFINIFWGKNLAIQNIIIVAIIVHFYVNGIHCVAYTYRTTMGLFNEGKIAPTLAAFINVILSVLLFKIIGVAGIFFATSISRMLTMGLIDPILIYKKMNVNPLRYYKKYFLFSFYVFIAFYLSKIIILLINGSKIHLFVIKISLYSAIFNVIMLAILYNTKEFEYIKDYISKRYKFNP